MLQLLFWFCYACAVLKNWGFTDPLFSRAETHIAPLSEYKPHCPEPNGNSSTRCEGKGTLNITLLLWFKPNPGHPSTLSLSGSKNCCQDHGSTKVCSVTKASLISINFSGGLIVPLRKQMGFAQPGSRINTFCRSICSGCNSGDISEAVLLPKAPCCRGGIAHLSLLLPCGRGFGLERKTQCWWNLFPLMQWIYEGKENEQWRKGHSH